MAFSRRTLLAGSLASLTLAACHRGTGGAVLKVGSQKGGTKAVLLASGVLEGAPYAVEWSEFPAAQNLLEALGSGAVDLGLIGDAPFQFAFQSGSPTKAVAVQRVEGKNPGILGIVAPAHSPLRTIHDLVGKRVATTHGSIGHYLILRALIANGHKPDAAHISFLSPSDSRAALQSGAVDAWSTWAPYTVAAIAEGARVLVDGRLYSEGNSFDVANEQAIVDKRPLLADFLKREAHALDWAVAHGGDYAKVLAHETGLPLPVAQGTVEAARRVRGTIDPALIRDQQVILDTFLASGEIKANRPVAQAFEPII
ncbi:aliphatic sulfonate ABC transporter periplasmic ligand-binding protein [Novosphingobium nitrogenifigens DSM 19370]|uniref:Putative aliphatic sulfonates-binding protein n=1 Tax=Novosphingobium nitrogenifigens DSM 19370 TaxID=983920 RepID=F1Z7F2_9SPHN|nr:ABC transporter substrate-binding protein [Novosphingobium nitrogenifigens]EGD59464.1 aliphatic sulfonate ABC transporter periplasmic ligand-binding protein [Novosphingobium nitrogenifigens DSM 19370]